VNPVQTLTRHVSLCSSNARRYSVDSCQLHAPEVLPQENSLITYWLWL
jgi:hypothetical protein